jgi:tetratricopeptide (TPR) repeat protein
VSAWIIFYMSLPSNREQEALAARRLAEQHYDRRAYQQALLESQKAIDLDPAAAESYVIQARTYSKLGDLIHADAAAARALSLNPGLATAHTARATIYLDRGQVPEAIEALHRALAIDPRLWTAHYDMGIAYSQQKQYRPALAEFVRAFTYHPARLTGQTIVVAALYAFPRILALSMVAFYFLPLIWRAPAALVFTAVLFFYALTIADYNFRMNARSSGALMLLTGVSAVGLHVYLILLAK